MTARTVRTSLMVIVLSPVLSSLQAAELKGQVGSVSPDGSIRVNLSGDFLPVPGDRVEVFVELPGVGKASVGNGIVIVSSDGEIVAKLARTTGKLRKGQLVAISSAMPLERLGKSVPVLIGRSTSAAKKAVTEAGFTLKVQIGIDAPTGVAPYTVYEQKPMVGSRLSADSVVTVVVYGGDSPAPSVRSPARTPSAGPPRSELPSTTAASSDEAVARTNLTDEELVEGRWVCTKSFLNGQVTYGYAGTQLVLTGKRLFIAGTRQPAVSFTLKTDQRPGHLDYEVESGHPLDAKRVEAIGAQTGVHRNLYRVDEDTLVLAESADAAQRPASIESAGIRHVYRRMKVREGWDLPERFPSELVPALGVRIARDSADSRQTGATRKSGVLVDGIFPDSPAETAGLRPNDVILEADGHAVETPREFKAVIPSYLTGNIVLLTVARQKETLILYATLQEGFDKARLVAATEAAAEQGLAWAQNDLGRFYQNGYGLDATPELAVQWYEKAARQGNPEAQFNLGSLYQHGKGVKQSDSLALEWYRKAADQEFTDGQVSLGNMYYAGLEVEQDRNEASRLFQLAASRGNRRAQHNLAAFYRFGDGVTKDIDQSRSLYLLAASQGQMESYDQLGRMYERGEGVERNDAEAARLFRIAAQAGLGAARISLAIMYQGGRGVRPDFDEARRLYSSAAEQGYADAMVGMGTLYEAGDGVEQDFDEAMQWYQKGAAQEDAQSYYRVGLLIYNGRGVTRDYEKAVGWFRAAARKGYANAETALGMAYEEGNGVAQDYQEAIRRYNAARKSGNGWAAYRLAIMHWNGRGVRQVTPTELLNEAIRNGSSEAHRAYALALEEDGRRGVSPFNEATRRKLITEHLRMALENGDTEAVRDLERLGLQP